MEIIAITSAQGEVIAPDWLICAESTHRELRPHLPVGYVARMQQIFAGGAEMAVAVRADAVVGVAVFRVMEKTYSGREMYCDDLVTCETARSSGVGKALLAYMETLARQRACNHLTLDSGTHRQQAHKFYFREGMTIPSFHFLKFLKT